MAQVKKKNKSHNTAIENNIFSGVALTLFFFSKFLKLDDSMLGTISSIGRIVSGLICAFAPSVWLFYLGKL